MPLHPPAAAFRCTFDGDVAAVVVGHHGTAEDRHYQAPEIQELLPRSAAYGDVLRSIVVAVDDGFVAAAAAVTDGGDDGDDVDCRTEVAEGLVDYYHLHHYHQVDSIGASWKAAVAVHHTAANGTEDDPSVVVVAAVGAVTP